MVRIHDYLKKRMRSNIVSDVNLGDPPSLETSDVDINQSNNQYLPSKEDQGVSSNVPFRSKIPVLIGSRIIQVRTVSYDTQYEADMVTTKNHYEGTEPTTYGEVNANSRVGEDRFEVLMKMIDGITKRMDRIEKKLQQMNKK